jgi:chromosome segregation protein
LYLKKIEIFGFKSFADKATIEFSRGSSAIIGPNGCGKSNIVDAVRWALGEQSVKDLRGGRMEDLIFCGSKERKPLNFAEVSLCFENVDSHLELDFAEMEITRRLYRSGESEYFINKTPCRLKDIAELFMDTGVGKEFYSIVGQNRVEKIISARPEDCRELIEEAAGTLKYRHRKREARLRLDDMRVNLQRIRDLIHELDNQIEPLKGQAELARTYMELRDTLKARESLVLNHRICEYKLLVEKVSEKLEKNKNETVRVISDLTTTVASLQETERRLEEVEDRKSALEKELNAAWQEKEQIEGRLRLLEEKKQNQVRRLEENRESRDNHGRKARELGYACVQHEEQLAEKKKEIEMIREEVDKLQQENERYRTEESLLQMEQLKQELVSTATRIEALEATLAEIVHRQERIESERADIEEQIENEREKVGSIGRKASEVEGERQAKKTLLSETLQKIDAIESVLEKTREKESSIEQQLAMIRERLSAGENKRWLLKKLEEDGRTSFQIGSEELLGNSSLQKILPGAIFSKIAVVPEFRGALEAVLGEKVFGVVATDEKAAVRAVNYLKNGRRGWATVFPLSTARKIEAGVASMSEKIKGVPGNKGSFLEICHVDPEYKEIGRWLLGNIYLTEDLEAALDVARESGYSVYAVTLDGEVVYPGGAIRGGGGKEEETRRWNREEEIKKIESKIARDRKEMEGLSGKLRHLEKQTGAYEEKQAHSREFVEKLKAEMEALERKRALLDQEKDHREANIRMHFSLAESLVTEEGELCERGDSLREELLQLNKRSATLESAHDEMKERHRHIIEGRDAVADALTRKKIEYNKVAEQRNYLAERLVLTRNDLQKVENEIAELDRNIVHIEELLVEMGEEKTEEVRKMDRLAAGSREKTIEYEDIRREYDTGMAEKKELEKEEQVRKNKRHRLERAEHRLEIEKTRLQSEYEHLQNLFREKFDAYPAREIDEPDYNEAEVMEEINRLKEEIELMGQVRIGAIDELERITERVSFLQEQEKDLIEGEESVKDILAEIDERIMNKLVEALEEIAGHFRDTFVELFGGGQAILKFTDPEAILDSGIEIVAQPPGKNLRNISLLSSGEKALTAIALIFALFRYKPAPFYFLDEIESSLDDSNLSRFIDFMDDAVAGSQFIFITHRRSTMEKADVVYGVTMPEPGISQIISMKVNEIAS